MLSPPPYIVVDCEVEAKTIRGRFCDPLERSHKLVMIQWLLSDEDNPNFMYNAEGVCRESSYWPSHQRNLWVGANVKFDALYCGEEFRKFIQKGGKVWDVTTVEYLLEGQNKFLKYSLNDLSKKYGGTQKDDEVGKRYAAGLTTLEIIDQIGLERYVGYALGDVKNTEIVFKAQWQRAQEQGQLQLIHDYMEHYLAVIEYEYNGQYIDKDKLEQVKTEQEVLCQSLHTKFHSYLDEAGWPKQVEFDENKTAHLRALLFGGEVKTKEQKPTGHIFKSGKQKGQEQMRWEEVIYPVKGCGMSSEAVGVTPSGQISTSKSSLEKLEGSVVETLRRYRKEFKTLSSYHNVLPEFINPYTGCTHPCYHTASRRDINTKGLKSETEKFAPNTGRLSATNPAAQTYPKSVLPVFTSRFGLNGCIITFDWKAFEICATAFVFNEPVLMQEILQGIDSHKMTASGTWKIPFDEVTPIQRTAAKKVIFGILYKQGYKSLAKRAGITEEEAKLAIDVIYERFPKIKLAHIQLNNFAQNSNYPFSYTTYKTEKDKTKTAVEHNIRACMLETPWGKRYFIDEKQGKDNRTYFSQQQLANIKIQGTATDIMNIAAGKVYRWLMHHRDKCLMIGEVHDELILDCHLSFKDKAIDTVKEIMENSAREFTGTELFKVDVNSGANRYECKGG